MRILVTGSSGHLGEALIRVLKNLGHEVTGLDLIDSPFTDQTGSIGDRNTVRQCVANQNAVLHTATLHKPHVATHTRQEFLETNINGTLNLLEESVNAGVEAFVFTSTTSTFGRAMTPEDGQAVWVTESLKPAPRNIYGTTKVAAEDLCELIHRDHGMPCLVLKTSRFFPEQDDRREIRDNYEDGNAKANEYLYRRVDLEDVVNAHLLAMNKAREIGFRRYIISATTPFTREDVAHLPTRCVEIVRQRTPQFQEVYTARGWKMFTGIDRVYDNSRARSELDWNPKYDFPFVIQLLKQNRDPRSQLARTVGAKGYHRTTFTEGPYPVD